VLKYDRQSEQKKRNRLKKKERIWEWETGVVVLHLLWALQGQDGL
jgi:hypothetical protein